MRTGFKLTLPILLLTLIISCADNKSSDSYLREVLSNLEKVQSATYYTATEFWQPGDTVATNIFRRYFKEYNNPSDSTIGASYVSLDANDTTKLLFGYDGNIRALVYDDVKGIMVDDFTSRPLPFRPLSPPFFCYAKNIIKYILSTEDSIQTDLKDLGESYYLKLVINEDKQVEFFGKAYYMPDNPYNWGETTSIYEVWISKLNDLPYKIRREMSRDISVATCSDVEMNKLKINDFNIYNYFPTDYEIRDYAQVMNKKNTSDLTGKRAPHWTLYDMNEQVVSLTDFKSKVLLVNFTGIGCGPCQASIPFLKTLKESFGPDDFELISIETWSRKAHSLQVYANKNQLNYKLLNATDEVIKDYQTGGSAPVFFILDEQRTIQKVFKGYSEESTDNKIMNAIKELI